MASKIEMSQFFNCLHFDKLVKSLTIQSECFPVFFRKSSNESERGAVII